MQKEVFLLDDISATEGNLEVVDKSVAGSFHRNHNNEAVKTIFSDSQFLCHFLPLAVRNIVYIVAIIIVFAVSNVVNNLHHTRTHSSSACSTLNVESNGIFASFQSSFLITNTLVV